MYLRIEVHDRPVYRSASCTRMPRILNSTSWSGEGSRISGTLYLFDESGIDVMNAELDQLLSGEVGVALFREFLNLFGVYAKDTELHQLVGVPDS